jgi:hypothetical protein
MSTTTLFVEILTIGLEALVWLGMALSLSWDPGPMLDFLKKIQSCAALVAPLLLALYRGHNRRSHG